MTIKSLPYKKYFNLYKKLILLKISPEALPYSPRLLLNLLVLYFLICVVGLTQTGIFAVWKIMLAYGASIMLSILFIAILLSLYNKSARLHKLLLAIFGVDVFFALLSIVMLFFNRDLQLFLSFCFLLWSLSIKTHIIEKGLNFSTIHSIGTVILFGIMRNGPIVLLIWPYIRK